MSHWVCTTSGRCRVRPISSSHYGARRVRNIRRTMLVHFWLPTWTCLRRWRFTLRTSLRGWVSHLGWLLEAIFLAAMSRRLRSFLIRWWSLLLLIFQRIFSFECKNMLHSLSSRRRLRTPRKFVNNCFCSAIQVLWMHLFRHLCADQVVEWVLPIPWICFLAGSLTSCCFRCLTHLSLCSSRSISGIILICKLWYLRDVHRHSASIVGRALLSLPVSHLRLYICIFARATRSAGHIRGARRLTRDLLMTSLSLRIRLAIDDYPILRLSFASFVLLLCVVVRQVFLLLLLKQWLQGISIIHSRHWNLLWFYVFIIGLDENLELPQSLLCLRD